jgi:isopenicillin N synthase-like dioxygenase
MVPSHILSLHATPKFSVLSPASASLPIMELSDLLLKKPHVQETLWLLLRTHGHVILKAKTSSMAAQVVERMKQSLCTDFFPSATTNERNVQKLQQGEVYISEKGVPMWKTGYELCDDIREAYRINCGAIDDAPWPTTEARQSWLKGMEVCRRVCDVCLDMIVGYTPKRRTAGDFSVLYAMHYFNDESSKEARQSGHVTGVADVTINVKEHVDPSLFVLEPFLAETEGLQVFCQSTHRWITCDGPSSPIHSALGANETAMVLFLGKALAANTQERLTPTLHRVIASPHSRRTLIYEQKYEEFFPLPVMD